MENIDKLVIIGANDFQKKLVMKAKDLGYETHVFAWEEGATSKKEADFFYPVDITKKEEILKYVKKIKPLGICSIASDLAMPTVNYIAMKLNIIGNSIETTEFTTNKHKMRNIFYLNKLPSPNFSLVSMPEDLNFEFLRFPLIIKPIDRSGSRGIYKVNSFSEIESAIIKAKKVSFTDKVLVEEYVDGKEFSIEYLSQDNSHQFLQITEKFTSGAPNFIEKAHLSPARVSEFKKKEILEVIENALDALKIRNGASHSEIKITESGDIKIIEIAARMGGDYIGSDMVQISTGFDFVKNVINVAVNKKAEEINIEESKIAIVGFILEEKDKQRFEELIKKYPKVIKEYNINSTISPVEDSSSRNGYFILEIKNKENLPEILRILNLED